MERKERKQINPIKNPKGKILHHDAITVTHFFFKYLIKLNESQCTKPKERMERPCTHKTMQQKTHGKVFKRFHY